MELLKTIGPVLLAAASTYVFVILLVRVTGKRTVSHLNSFDWVFNFAIGSLAASAILSPDKIVAAFTGMVAIVALQYFLTQLTTYSQTVCDWVKESPRVLMLNGEFYRKNMRKERINEAEMLAAVRTSGHDSLDEITAVIMESDGELSVIGPYTEPDEDTAFNALPDEARSRMNGQG